MSKVETMLEKLDKIDNDIVKRQEERSTAISECKAQFSDEELQKMKVDCETILNDATKVLDDAKIALASAKEKVKGRMTILQLKVDHLPKVNGHYNVEGSTITFQRDNKSFSYDFTSENWQKELRAELKEVGMTSSQINNIAYKSSLAVKAHNAK